MFRVSAIVVVVVLLTGAFAMLCGGCGKPSTSEIAPTSESAAPSAAAPTESAAAPAEPGTTGKEGSVKEESKMGPKLEGEDNKPVVKTKSGLQYIVLEAGKGDKPKQGDTIVAEYTGWLTDGTKFDSSKDHPDEFSFAVGTGQVIPGWDEALSDMKVGERRKLIVPPDLGYGDRGAGGVIPPNATLIFEVKLVKIK